MASTRNFEVLLQEIFPHTPPAVIADIVGMVIAEDPSDSFEGKIENMVNLLSGDGAQGPMPEIVTQNSFQTRSNPRYERLYLDLLNCFPDAKPEFLINYCQQSHSTVDLDDAIADLNENGYEKSRLDPGVIWEQLKTALPKADPSYLKKEANRLINLPQQEIDDFLQNAIEQDNYPTMQDYLKNKKEQDEISFYTDFKVEKFLEEVPNAVAKFSDPNRKLLLDENSPDSDIQYSIKFLYNQYRFIRKVHIDQLFRWKRKNLVQICDRLDRMNKNFRKARELETLGELKNIPLLQLITYLKNRKTIKNFIKNKDDLYRAAREEARLYNLLETCQCCFDEELIPEECYSCLKNCIFCKDCVRLGAKHVIGKGELRFPCLANCDSEFSLQILQMVLPKRNFERLAQKIASEEIKKANVEGLETCPFCDFAMVLPPNEKIFKCNNEECLIESCRECRHKSHIPLHCDEIEYDEDVRRRTYIENKMTEALTRKCYKCNKTFIKTTGCNKMECPCGAKMCYLCGVAVQDYSHFGTGRCALHTNDTEINLNRILQSAQSAKEELGNVIIKFDPSLDIRDYYPPMQ